MYIYDDEKDKEIAHIDFYAPVVRCFFKGDLYMVTTYFHLQIDCCSRKTHVHLHTPLHDAICRLSNVLQPKRRLRRSDRGERSGHRHDGREARFDSPDCIFFFIQLKQKVGKQPEVIISAHDSAISCLTLSEEGELLATASARGSLIRVFDVKTAHCISSIRRGHLHTSIVNLEWE